MPQPPAAVQGSANLSNVAINAGGITYVPLVSAAAGQQPSNSSNIRPPLNADSPRWIGRENMNNSNPFCTLPGGVSISGYPIFHHLFHQNLHDLLGFYLNFTNPDKSDSFLIAVQNMKHNNCKNH